MPTTIFDPNIGDVKNPSFTGMTLGASGVTDMLTGITGKTDGFQRRSLPVTAVTNTDYTLSVPPGSTIRSMVVYTTTAYTGTTGDISIGSAAAGAQYVAATDIKAIGVVPLTFVSAAAASLLSMPAGSPNLFIRIAQSTTPTAVGAAMLVVNYIQA